MSSLSLTFLAFGAALIVAALSASCANRERPRNV
ncbi:hypothetical protein HD841_000704 [Sphingomonas melonis]|uniref:Uncharacterized protein n=1 Tax=Sphingomonas melonis TaxID=152682 RepID=A0A7Y9FKH0_9SPHN|nr:hypothetical protein [Sphingomonas melonis]